jgi:HD-like signal output (HDOD) protein
MPQADAIEQVLDSIGELPALPGTVAAVLEATSNPDVEMADVCKIVEHDPAMAAKILKVSNSSYYGMKQFVGTIKLALVILGVREVRNIVLGISVFDTLKDDTMPVKVVQDIWQNSLTIAAISKKLTNRLNLGMQGEEFIAGLLADIGKMIMFRELKKEYQQLHRQYGRQPLVLLEEERAEFGYTHADAATALATKWSLPKRLADSLWTQYPHPDRPLAEASDDKLAAVIRIARSVSIDDFSAEQPPLSLTDTEAWAILDTAKQPIPQEQRRDTLVDYLAEVKSSPQLAL